MGLPEAELPGLAVVVVRGEAGGVASLERGALAMEEGSTGFCTGVGAAVDADAAA